MEWELLKNFIDQMPVVVLLLIVVWRAIGYINKINEKHQLDLRGLQKEMNDLNANNLKTTVEMYNKQNDDNKDRLDTQERIYSNNIQRLENMFIQESENSKAQLDSLKEIYENQNLQILQMRDDMNNYKSEVESKRKEDQKLFSKLLAEEKESFNKTVESFNGAIAHFENNAKEVEKLRKEMNTKMDNLSDSLEEKVSDIKAIVLKK